MEEAREWAIQFFRKWILKIDIAFHIIVALLLLIACGVILFYSLDNILHPSRASIIHLVNDVLLVLIILEILWTVIRFLKKQKFILGPFFAIGIIAGIRRILLIEAQSSLTEEMSQQKLLEMGLSAGVILVLIVAYYIAVKAQKLEQ